MRVDRYTINTLFIILLPFLVALFDIGVFLTVVWILVGLGWRWWLVLSELTQPPVGADMILETISGSHFVEKVRWCLDKLGVAYDERANVGTLGAFTLGRTVPRLHVRTGSVVSRIGNSSDILRYLWGRYAAERPEQAAFLKPSPESLALEQSIDACGVDLQRWIYYHILPDRELTLRLWGVDDASVPSWQRNVAGFAYPLSCKLIRRTFRITAKGKQRSVENIDAFLAGINETLADGRTALLGGAEHNYVDYAFAAICGLWHQDPAYGGGKAEGVRIEFSKMPAELIREVEDWKRKYPAVDTFISSMYNEERNN